MMMGMKGGAVWAVPAGQQQREGVFVPGEDQAEDGRGRDAGAHACGSTTFTTKAWKRRVAVDHRRFFIFPRNLVDEALEQPHRERQVHGAV